MWEREEGEESRIKVKIVGKEEGEERRGKDKVVEKERMGREEG